MRFEVLEFLVGLFFFFQTLVIMKHTAGKMLVLLQHSALIIQPNSCPGPSIIHSVPRTTHSLLHSNTHTQTQKRRGILNQCNI